MTETDTAGSAGGAEVARWRRRAAAFVLDCAVLSATYYVFAVSNVPAALAGLVILAAYFALFTAFWHGQTPAKRLLGIRVVAAAPRGPVSRGQAFGRELFRFLLFFFLVIPGLLDGLWALFDRQGRTWHDRISETAAVEAREGRRVWPALIGASAAAFVIFALALGLLQTAGSNAALDLDHVTVSEAGDAISFRLAFRGGLRLSPENALEVDTDGGNLRWPSRSGASHAVLETDQGEAQPVSLSFSHDEDSATFRIARREILPATESDQTRTPPGSERTVTATIGTTPLTVTVPQSAENSPGSTVEPAGTMRFVVIAGGDTAPEHVLVNAEPWTYAPGDGVRRYDDLSDTSSAPTVTERQTLWALAVTGAALVVGLAGYARTRAPTAGA